MTITDAQFQELKDSVDKLHAALPALFAFRDNFELWAKETGVFDHIVQDVLSRVPKPSSAPASTPVAISDSPTMPGLSSAQVAALIRALTNGVNAGFVFADIRDRIQSELAAGVYSYGVRDVIDAVKLWYYSGAIASDQQAIYPYLQIIDQRDPNNKNVTLPPGDPRWVKVGTATTTGTYDPNNTLTTLAQAGVYIEGGKVGIGMRPDQDYDAKLQILGAEILGRSNTQGTDGQNPAEPHTNILSVAGNDGGMRLIQYGGWGPDGLKRNTTNRDMTIFALDSMGEICVSKDQAGAAGRTYGQHFYVRFDWARKVVQLDSFQPGWKLELRESSAYGAADIPVAGT